MMTGKELIEAICEKIRQSNDLCYDSTIVQYISKLDRYELIKILKNNP
jgi:hypothetical protein